MVGLLVSYSIVLMDPKLLAPKFTHFNFPGMGPEKRSTMISYVRVAPVLLVKPTISTGSSLAMLSAVETAQARWSTDPLSKRLNRSGRLQRMGIPLQTNNRSLSVAQCDRLAGV